jgi:hypothetical protein
MTALPVVLCDSQVADGLLAVAEGSLVAHFRHPQTAFTADPSCDTATDTYDEADGNQGRH